MSSDDVVIDLKSATQSSSEHAEEVDSTKAKRPHRGKKSKKHKIVSAEVEEDEEHYVSLDERTYFANYDGILKGREESIVFVSSGSRAVYKSVDALETILKTYSSGNKLATEETQPMPPCWIDIQYPTVETMVLISRAFGIHTLTIEDCLSETEDQHQKNELFDSYRFLSFSEYHYIPYTNVLGNVDVHIILPETNTNILISLHNGPALFIGATLRALASPRNSVGLVITDGEELRNALQEEGKATSSSHRFSGHHSGKFKKSEKSLPCLIPSSYWMMYVILDNIVDRFVQLVDTCTNEVDQLDSLVLDLPPREQADLLLRIGEARKQMSLLRLQLLRKLDILQTISQEAKEAAVLAHDALAASQQSVASSSHEPSSVRGSSAIPGIGAMVTHKGIGSIRIFLRDILDHVNTMLIDLEQAKDTLQNLTNAYQARVSIEMSLSASEQNKVMKKFSAMATIILPLTFIPSLWGMNVPVPGKNTKGTWAFWTIVGSLLGAGVIATFIFWRIKWL